MARGLLNKYIWVLDTIQRYGRIRLSQLDTLWRGCDLSGGEPLNRRTFYNYRIGIEDLFGIHIGYDNSVFEYYIEGGQDTAGMSRWLIDSMSVSGMLSGAATLADRIMLENVPSAKEFLPTVIEAMNRSRAIEMAYTPFYRVNTEKGIRIEPYFLRIFRQRWYLVGYNIAEKKIKTYSLDRIASISITDRQFIMPDMSVSAFFCNFFGITTSNAEAKEILLKVSAEQAKYFRALPLHPSQQERICDGYSVFSYRMCITYDFVQEILSHGEKITVIAPPELRSMITDTLRKSLANYTSP